MNWLSLFAALARIAAEFVGWLRERALLATGETRGRAQSEAAHARVAAEQGKRMREIASSPPSQKDVERRLDEGSA
jgi:hypothetical protein